MDILQVLVQLRDDIRTWVSNNLSALNDAQSGSLNALELKLTNKINEIVQENKFSGDYNDLTNTPLKEDNSGEFVIADENNNIIFKISKNGLETTDIKSNGVNIIEKMNLLEGEHKTDISSLDDRIKKYDEAFKDLESDNFIIADNSNNKIASAVEIGQIGSGVLKNSSTL